jgi:hypothetical protein
MALPIKETFCIGCGRTYDLSSFYKSPNPRHYNKYLPYCKDCCRSIVKENIKEHKSLEHAMWVSCAEIGIPFVRRVFVELEEKVKARNKSTVDYNYMGNYIQTMNALRKKSDHWQSFADTDIPLGELETVEKHEISIKAEAEKFKLDWGYQEIEDYQFLEYRFDEYTHDLGILSPSQETLYRRLCLVELAIRKKDEEHEDTKDEQKQMIQLMKTLGIDNFQNSRDMSMQEKIIEAQIAWMEEEEPAFHYRDLEKYKDFLGAETYWENHVIRPLGNLLTGSKEYTLKETDDNIGALEEGQKS